MKIKIKDLGDSVLVPLPEEVLLKLGVKVGDDLYVTETPTGLLLTRENPDRLGKRNDEEG